MSTNRILLFSSLFLALLGLRTSSADSQTELFAAMIMTKAQQASSIPTDSGILVRHAETGVWKRLGPKIQMISSATVDPSNPDTIFFACGNGIARTTDGGANWRLVTGWRENDALQIAIDPTNSDLVYAATAWGVTISKDGGDSWTAANKGLPEYFSKGIVIDHQRPKRLLLATTTGLFESKNQARSWKRVPSFPKVAALRLRRSYSNPDVWLAGTEGQGVWMSRNDGKTWKPSAPELKEANVYAVAMDTTDSSLLAAGGWNTGAYISTDGGDTWRKTTGKLPSPNITAAVFDENNSNRLWISTFEEGTFYSDDRGKSWINAQLDVAYVFDLGFLPASISD